MITAFWDLTPLSLVERYWCFRVPDLYPEDWDSRLPPAGTYLPDYTTFHPRQLQS
jgi:hypothetical protein